MAKSTGCKVGCGSTVVELLTDDPRVKALNPTAGTARGKMAKSTGTKITPLLLGVRKWQKVLVKRSDKIMQW